MSSRRTPQRRPVSVHSRRSSELWFALTILILLAIILGEALLYLRRHSAGPAAMPPVASSLPAPADPIAFAGLPQSDQPVTILHNTAYIVGYSETRRDPLWVCYRVIHMEHPYNLPRPTGKFLTDTRTVAKVTHDDYTGGGYDRGHMAPNAAIAHCFGEQAQHETFFMSNIVPQAAHLNRDVWEKLEHDELVFADRPDSGGTVYVIDGPLFNAPPPPAPTLKSGVAVPDACYKILLESTPAGLRTLSVIMPQTVTGTELPQQFLTPIATIEAHSHIHFFPGLDAKTHDALAARKPVMW